MSKLPQRLFEALTAVVNNEGDDLYFALGYLSKSTARSYLSQLKSRGLAYTYLNNGTVEVWANDKGRKLCKPPQAKEGLRYHDERNRR